MVNIMRHKHIGTGTVCIPGTGDVVTIDVRTGDTKGWFMNMTGSEGDEGFRD